MTEEWMNGVRDSEWSLWKGLKRRGLVHNSRGVITAYRVEVHSLMNIKLVKTQILIDDCCGTPTLSTQEVTLLNIAVTFSSSNSSPLLYVILVLTLTYLHNSAVMILSPITRVSLTLKRYDSCDTNKTLLACCLYELVIFPS